MKKYIVACLFLAGLLFVSQTSLAHCDTKDGPVVADAIKAIEKNNINYVLKWEQPAYEKDIN
jgi:hypothetical protein